MPRKNRNHNERYGNEHRRAREASLPMAYFTPCARCGKDMLPGQDLDLDHDEVGGYLGFSHRRCNRAAGARKGNRDRGIKGDHTSRDW